MTVASDSIYSYKSFWAYLAEELDLSALPRPEEGLVSIGIDSLAVFEISVVASELACSSHNPVPMSAFGLELKDAREITGQDVYLWYVEMKASLGAGRIVGEQRYRTGDV